MISSVIEIVLVCFIRTALISSSAECLACEHYAQRSPDPVVIPTR
jgi:hypothetical protein